MLDQVDVFFLKNLHAEWADYPPLRVVVAALAGVKPRERGSKNFAELLGMFPAGRI